MSKAAELAALIGSQTALSNRNLIINGTMQVAQRGTSETGVTSGGYKNAPDRFALIINSAGTWTVSQSTTAPEGFSSSYKLDCTVADASLAAGDYLLLAHKFEGQNLQQLKKGTSNAQPVTLSFWVRSAKTGTYVAELTDSDNSRQINKSYTISSANTWEYKTITYDGDTTGALDNDANNSFLVQFWLAAGSTFSSGTLATSWETLTQANRAVGNVNLADSTSNDFYITGVQLEIGEQATPFEHRSYGDELARCKRYFERFERQRPGAGSAGTTSLWAGPARSGASNVQGPMHYVEKRNNPTISVSSAGHLNAVYPISPFNAALSGFGIDGNAGTQSAYINATGSGSPGSDCASFVYIGNAAGYLDIDAEL
jgi:hypothetical protein